MKEFVHFSTTDVFVPVSQLSTRDLFDFLENLKIKQDFFVLSCSHRSIIRTKSTMISLFQIIFRNSFQEGVVSWVFGDFTKSIVVSMFRFWHFFFFRNMLKFWLVNEIINFNLRRHVLIWLKVDRHGFSGGMFVDSWLNHPLNAM